MPNSGPSGRLLSAVAVAVGTATTVTASSTHVGYSGSAAESVTAGHLNCTARRQSSECITDHPHKFYDERCADPDGCCAVCVRRGDCKAWAFSDFRGKGAYCSLFNASGGRTFDGPCTSSGGETPQPSPPPGPPPPRPYPDRTPPGPACKDCPNIIFSITDDQDLVLGGWDPMTQTQDLIASKGVTMTSWRIHTPVCSPSRSELVSGRYYHNIKSTVPVPVEDRILYAGTAHVNGSLYANKSFGVYMRREKGYRVGIFGKANFNTYEGFDRWFQGVSLAYGPVKWEDDESPTGIYTQKPNEYPTALLGNKTVEWLQRASVTGNSSGGRPFFAYFASHCPHFPATPAHWYADACKGTAAIKYPNFNHTTPLYHELIATQPPMTAIDATLVDQLARSRCQCLLSVDDAHAAIWKTVEDLGLADKTFFFYTSDHGYNLGGHRLTSEKMNLYEHTLRIPLVVRGPGVQAGIELPHLGTNVDLAPTWLDIAGIDKPACMDGRSIYPLLISGTMSEQVSKSTAHSIPPHSWRNESFFQYYDAGPWAPANGGDDCPICTAGKGTVRKFDDASNTYIGIYVNDAELGSWKYAEFQNNCTSQQFILKTCFNNITTRELFNMRADPHELDNIVDSADVNVVAELAKRLRKYYPCQGDLCP